ncbi:predicted protein [Chaetoceros tenuissimus]|uniref:Uncharacterized protein n=1 Tax=Chaetoceros tenuissimus TaxID=426638 RepID=A0AAD3CLI6_9STRA|nr:predicted protein [Chaetoceros tenuissimus]
MKFSSLSTLLLSSLLRKSTSEATPDTSNEDMAVKKWTRKELLLENMQNFYEKRSLTNTKVSGTTSGTVPSFLAERMKKARKLQDEGPTDLTPCEQDIIDIWMNVHNILYDSETGYSYWGNLVLVDDNFFTWSGDEDFLTEFTAKCEAGVDGTVVFANTIYDECYYRDPCSDDFEDPDCDREAIDYSDPFGSSANLPECVPKTCSSTEEWIDGLDRFFSSNEEDDCQVTVEISDGPGDVICIQNLFELAMNVLDIVYDDPLYPNGTYGSESYDETTNTLTWVTTDEQLANFTTFCESFGGTAYLTSGTYGSNDCYYMYFDDDYEHDNMMVPNYVDYLDCFPNTCGEAEPELLLSILYRIPGCPDEVHTGVPISTDDDEPVSKSSKSKKSKGKKAKGMKVGKAAKVKAGKARI